MQMSLSERDLKVIWHPYTPQKYASRPIGIIRGEGIYLYDEEDNRYIDAISSWWVTLHGHGHPYIAHKVHEQAKLLEQVIFAGFTHLPAILLAEKLLPLIPGKLSKIFYSDNGSTATEVAIKMALQYWWNQELGIRNKVIALKDGYHGDTFGSMSASSRSVFTKPFQDKLFEVIFIDITAPFQDQLAAIHPEEIAAFIYEPLIQGAGGMKMHSADRLDELLHFMKSHNIICIADEVMTGFGRTGTLFASEQCNEKPDIVCLSKGLTGGTLALGVTACNEKIYHAFVTDDRHQTFFHGHSFTANPIACTAALASIDLLLYDDCQSSITRIISLHKSFLISLLDSSLSKKIKNARQQGTIIAFEFISKDDGYLNTISDTITQKALKKGVFIRPLGNTIYLMPPYCISEIELRKVYDVLIEIIGD